MLDNRKYVDNIKKSYPTGTKIMLIEMYDKQAVPPGTVEKVISVDDLGTIHVAWENGSTPGIVLGFDRFYKINK